MVIGVSSVVYIFILILEYLVIYSLLSIVNISTIESNPFTFLLATNALAKRPCVACCCYQTTLNAPTVHEQVQVHLCKHDLARKLSFLPCQSLLKNCFAVAVCDLEFTS